MSEFSVLTGDLVGSSKLSPVEFAGAMVALREGSELVENWLGSDTYFTQCRGDGWQMYIDDAGFALRATLVVKAHLRSCQRGLATRVAIANGRERRPVSANLNAENGAAFIRSGVCLDNMRKPVNLEHSRSGAMGAVARLADAISRRWTQKQARVMAIALAPDRPPVAQIAAQFGVTRQAVSQSLSSANHGALQDALHMIEAK